MPRSVNSVASRARRKKILKLAKGYFGRRKNVWTVAKNAVEKAMLYAYRDRKTKKRNSDHFGLRELTQEQDYMVCLTANLWGKSKPIKLS
jgi:ribosomal protein L20